MNAAKHTPGPWDYVPGTENHGPYVANGWGAGDICDCYAMSNPSALSVRNGGDSRPINHQHDEADANARLIAAAPELLGALKRIIAIRNWRHDEDGSARREYDNAADEADAAIAKAEVRSDG